MQEVEKYSKIQHCSHIYLGTYEFQARTFYEKLGFKYMATISTKSAYNYDAYVMRKEIL